MVNLVVDQNFTFEMKILKAMVNFSETMLSFFFFFFPLPTKIDEEDEDREERGE